MKPFNPKSTIFTNEMLDIIMPDLSPNAWKVICLAMRKTAGWADASTESGRKESDVISLSQFMKGCGINGVTTVRDAIEECLDKQYLIRHEDGQSFRYSLNINYEIPTLSESDRVELSTLSESDRVTISESDKTNNKSFNNKEMREEYLNNVENRKEQTRQSVAKWEAKKDGVINVDSYPEDTRPIIESVCILWSLTCPPIKSKQSGFWIDGARELEIACDGYKGDALKEIKKDLENQRRGNSITISSPMSLVNMARAKVGEMREKDKPKPNFPPGAAEVWIGGKRYTPEEMYSRIGE
jgi:hypothetical protein